MIRFSKSVIDWQRRRGRHDLPWQQRDAYAVWISEIMLQQTQVATVIPYYRRFMQRFPDVATLARASLDDVLTHWAGLGYYSRARNLHRAAGLICDRHDARFPSDFADVLALPGVGRSTAAAVMVFAFGQRHAILDGNVKRVLARYFGIDGYPGRTAIAHSLWQAAERLLPKTGIESYTQGLMDLGASVCVRTKPACGVCPVARGCVALRERRIDELPAPRPRKALPHKETIMLVVERAGAVLLEKRPPAGIWGGLWCFPELAADEDAASVCAQRFGAQVGAAEALPVVQHGFTHFSLTISPRHLRATRLTPRAAEAVYRWIELTKVKDAAIPAPVKQIVDSLKMS